MASHILRVQLDIDGICQLNEDPTSADKYRAIVSWGEIDPGFGARQVLLATAQDGAPLDTEGPRLVVPGDVKGGRYVSTVDQLYIGDADHLVRRH